MPKEKILTISILVDESTDLEALERDVRLFNEGATSEAGSVTFNNTTRNFAEITNITLIDLEEDASFPFIGHEPKVMQN